MTKKKKSVKKVSAVEIDPEDVPSRGIDLDSDPQVDDVPQGPPDDWLPPEFYDGEVDKRMYPLTEDQAFKVKPKRKRPAKMKDDDTDDPSGYKSSRKVFTGER